MGLKSDKDKAIEEQYRQAQNIRNPFEGYNLTFKPLDTATLDTRTEDYYGQALSQLRRLLQQKRNEDIRAMTQRLVNQNIIGGVREAFQNRLASQYSGEIGSQLGALGIEKAKMRLQNLLTAQDQARIYDQLMMGLLQNQGAFNLNKQTLISNLASNLDDTTWLDDVLAVANTTANVIGAISGYQSNKKG